MHFAIALGSSCSGGIGPDDAVAIARRHQEHRNAARVHQALLDGLVAIAVAQRDLVVADAGRHDGAIRRGGAVGHRVRAMRAEHARRIALALADRAAVAEHRAERTALDAHVGAKQVLAEEVEERAADRRLQECDAALMAGRCPRVFALAIVARQRRGIGRQQVGKVTLHRRLHAATDERCRVVEYPDELIRQGRDFDADRAREIAAGHEENRHLGIALAHCAQQLGRLGVGVLVVLPLTSS